MNNLKEKVCDVLNCHESLITLEIYEDEIIFRYSNWISYTITSNEIIYHPDVVNPSRIKDERNKGLVHKLLEICLFLQKKIFC